MRAELLLGTAALMASGCITTKVVNIGQKTSLENQLMGEAEPLTEEQILAASVRAQDGVHAGSTDDLQSRALRARRRQLFNRDDVEELTAAGCLGEALEARLAARPCDAVSDPETLALRDRMIVEENVDRAAIVDWALGVDPVLTPADRPQVVELYHRLVSERAKAGEWVQEADGRWVKK